MSFDLDTLNKPRTSPLRRVRAAVELAAQAGCGVDPWDKAGARHGGNGQPRVKDPNDARRHVYMQRPSTRAKNFDTNDENLKAWYRTTGALGAALNPERAAALVTYDLSDKDGKRAANRLAEDLANDEAEADEGLQYGNLTHALCEARAKGLDWEAFLEPLDEDERAMFRAVVASFEQALARYQIEVLETEVTVVNFAQECAGNLDFYARHNGETVVCDIKTNDGLWLDRSWLSFILQTWLYATSEALYDPRTEEFAKPPADLSHDRSLIFHTDWRTWWSTGKVETKVYELKLSEMGPLAAELAGQVADMKRRASECVSELAPPEGELIEQLEASIAAANDAKAERAKADIKAAIDYLDGAEPAMRCQSLMDDGWTPCPDLATHQVRGLPGYEWSGLHCPAHTQRVSAQFDHQGGCVITALSDGASVTVTAAAPDPVEQIIEAFPGSTEVEVEPLPERQRPQLPRFRARNGGRQDELDYLRARVDELIEAGHEARIIQVWADENLPGIGPSHPPLDRAGKLLVEAVLREVETDLGRWVDESETEVLAEHYARLAPEPQAEFLRRWQNTDWNPQHRFTRARADVLIDWLHELEADQ